MPRMRRRITSAGPDEGRAERHLQIGLAATALVLFTGTVGFMLTERLSPLVALYDTISVMSTSGGLERPQTGAGRALAVVILVAGISSLFYTFGALAEYLIEGHFGRTIGRRRMDRSIERLHDHVIICGYGRVGRRVARELDDAAQPFAVVDPREVNAEEMAASGYLHVRGDATTDEVLLRAGVRRARSLLAATDADTENIAITLSARALAPNLWIIARSNHDETESKLLRAGANRVLSPYAQAGHRMAVLARRPAHPDVRDAALEEAELDLALEELLVREGSELIGLRLPLEPGARPLVLRDRRILALRRAGISAWVTAPWPEGTRIGPGDRLIMLLASGQHAQESASATEQAGASSEGATSGASETTGEPARAGDL